MGVTSSRSRSRMACGDVKTMLGAWQTATGRMWGGAMLERDVSKECPAHAAPNPSPTNREI